MRNLKKILALVLALMMVVSMMVTASATSFTDDADINVKYAEAVSVLSGIGVIRGLENEDGSFRFAPKGELNRAQAATIISYVLLGTLDGIKDEVSIYENPFTDVAEWAVPYVLFAHSRGIIIGRNTTTFDPNATITGYELGKMLLIAAELAENSDFVQTVYIVDGKGYATPAEATVASLNAGGAAITTKSVAKTDWQVIVAKGLKGAGIWANEFSLSKKLTREEACFLAFNTMKAENTDYAADKDTLLERVFEDAKNEDVLLADDFGRPETNKWTLDGNTIYVTYAKPVATVNGADFDHDSTANAKIYNFDSAVITFNGGTNANFDTMAELEKPGVTIELFGEYNKETKLYDIDTVVAYAYEMATVKNIDDDKNITLTTVAGDIAISAPAENEDPSDLYAHVSAYKKGDVLSLIAVPGYHDESDLVVLESAVAEFVNGAVTATGAGYFRVNGVKQVSGALSNGSYTSLGTTGNFYLDPNGLVLGFGIVNNIVEVDTDYIYVLATASKAAVEAGEDTSDGLFGTTAGTAGKAAAAQAMVVNITTGEISTVNLGIVYDEDADKYFYADKNGRATELEVTTAAASDAKAGFYTYTVLADGSYVLIEKQTTKTVKVEEDKSTLNADLKLYATSSTEYTRVTISTVDGTLSTAVKNVSVTNRTGVANFPYGSWKYEGEALVFVDDESGVATDIYVVSLATYAPASTKGYAVYAGEGETDSLGTKHGFYVGGEYVEYYVTADMSSAVEGALYYVTNTNGIVTAIENSSFTKAVTGEIVYIDAGLGYVLIDGNTYTLKDGYVVVDSTDDYAVSKLTVGETVELYTYSSKVVYAIIVDAE